MDYNHTVRVDFFKITSRGVLNSMVSDGTSIVRDDTSVMSDAEAIMTNMTKLH